MNGKTLFRLLFFILLLPLFAGCGRQPYLLSVHDGNGIEKGAHVLWDQGGSGSAKTVGVVRDIVESGNAKKPVLIRFDLKDEFRETIRDNVSGAVMNDPAIAQGAFVLLIGGTGENRDSLKPGLTIQETRPAASAADYASSFFGWLRNARIEELKVMGGVLLLLAILLKIVKRVFRLVVVLAILGAVAYGVLSLRSDWAGQKQQLRQGVSNTLEQATDWVARHADELRDAITESVEGE